MNFSNAATTISSTGSPPDQSSLCAPCGMSPAMRRCASETAMFHYVEGSGSPEPCYVLRDDAFQAASRRPEPTANRPSRSFLLCDLVSW